MINITNYNELFRFFDGILSTRSSGGSFFHSLDMSLHFGEVLESYDRCKDVCVSKVAFSQLLSATSFGYFSFISVPTSEKSKVRRYELSFFDTFAILRYYVGELGYYTYNLYTGDKGILVKRSLFESCVNLVIHYRSKIFILHNWVCDTPNSLFLTILSPCRMFAQNEFDI